MRYAAICCTAKDEDHYLKEWIIYHAIIGFEHFFIYDNCSLHPIKELLDGFFDSNRITILRNEKEQSQATSYMHCLHTFGKNFFWIAFLDVDEFISLQTTKDIKAFLGEYENYAGVGLTWRVFSSNNHEKRPSLPVIEAYNKYITDDIHIKSIVQPSLVQEYSSPHTFIYTEGRLSVDTSFTIIPKGFSFTIPQTDKAYINHYYYKSRESFQEKINRNSLCNAQRAMEEFNQHLTLASKKDLRMSSYTTQVKSNLQDNHVYFSSLPPFLKSFDGSDLFISRLFSHVKEVLKTNETLHASICLCYAALYIKENTLFSSNLWVLRAKIALQEERYKEAEKNIARALSYEIAEEAYITLAEIFLKQHKVKEAKQALQIISVCKKAYI